MKKILRSIIEIAARSFISKIFFRLVIHSFSLFGKVWGFFWVRSILDVPPNSNCHWSVQIKYPKNIKISGPIMISPGCVLGAKETIIFGSQVRLSQGVHIETASLDLNSGLPYKHVAYPIRIGDGVWLGAHVIVLGGVTIGANAVVGAGVVVSKDIPADAIVVGTGYRYIEKKANYQDEICIY